MPNIKNLQIFESSLIKKFVNFRREVNKELAGASNFIGNRIDTNKIKQLVKLKIYDDDPEEESPTHKLNSDNSFVISFKFLNKEYSIVFIRADDDDDKIQEFLEESPELNEKEYREKNELRMLIYPVNINFEDGQWLFREYALISNNKVYNDATKNSPSAYSLANLLFNEIGNSDASGIFSEREDQIVIIEEALKMLDFTGFYKEFLKSFDVTEVVVHPFACNYYEFMITFLYKKSTIGFGLNRKTCEDTLIGYLIIYVTNLDVRTHEELVANQDSDRIATVVYNEIKGRENDLQLEVVGRWGGDVRMVELDTSMNTMLEVLVKSRITGRHFEVIDQISELGLKNNFVSKREVNPKGEKAEKGKRIDVVWYDPVTRKPLVAFEVTHSSEPLYDLLKMIEINPKVCVIYTKEGNINRFASYFKDYKVFSNQLRPNLILISPDAIAVFEKGTLKKKTGL